MKILFGYQNGVMYDIVPHFEEVSSVDEADKIVLTNDVLDNNINIINQAKEQGKKVIICSHCYASTGDYTFPHNYKPISDKYLVWGDVDYELSKVSEINDKTVITGTPIFNHRYEKQINENNNILFVPTRENGQDVSINKNVSDALISYDNFNIYTKTLPCHSNSNYSNPIQSGQDDIRHVDICFEILSKVDLVVSTDHTSSMCLFAMSCDIPIIYVNDFGIKNIVCRNFLLSGEYETSLINLYITINDILKNDYRKDKRRYWYKKCVYDSKNSVERICNEIINT